MKCPLCSKDFETAEYGTSVPCTHCGDFVKVPVLHICPNCFNKSETRRRICIECGYDFDSGCVIATQKGTEAEYGLIQRLARSLREAMPGLFRPAPLIGFILCAAAGVGMVISGSHITIRAHHLWTLKTIGVTIYLQGAAFICNGEISLLSSALQDMSEKTWKSFLFFAAAAPAVWLSIILMLKNSQ